MNFDDVYLRIKRKNQILFTRDSECLQELLSLIRTQKHRTIVMWILEWAEKSAATLTERYPNDKRPITALHLCKEWAKGNVKMPEAKRALLDVHAMAKELTNPVDVALCHAVGQACASVHVETHAIGYVMYALTAIVREHDNIDFELYVEQTITNYVNSLCELLGN